MKVPIQSWSLHDTLRRTLTFFLAFFLGWRMPNLIIGLSGRWAPNSWLRTQETVPNFRIVIRDTSTWDIHIWNSAHSFVHTSLSLPNTLSFSKSTPPPSTQGPSNTSTNFHLDKWEGGVPTFCSLLYLLHVLPTATYTIYWIHAIFLAHNYIK